MDINVWDCASFIHESRTNIGRKAQVNTSPTHGCKYNMKNMRCQDSCVILSFPKNENYQGWLNHRNIANNGIYVCVKIAHIFIPLTCSLELFVLFSEFLMAQGVQKLNVLIIYNNFKQESHSHYIIEWSHVNSNYVSDEILLVQIPPKEFCTSFFIENLPVVKTALNSEFHFSSFQIYLSAA